MGRYEETLPWEEADEEKKEEDGEEEVKAGPQKRIRFWNPRAWPVWLIWLGVAVWLLVLLFLSPFVTYTLPDESTQQGAYRILVVGTVLIVLPGVLMGLYKTDLRLFLYHVSFAFFLAPLSLYPWINAWLFTTLQAVICIIIIFLSVNLVEELDRHLKSKFADPYGYVRFVAADPEILFLLVLGGILFAWGMQFISTDTTIEDVDVYPGRPIQYENFTITVTVTTEENLTGIIGYRIDPGDVYTETELNHTDNRTYSIEFDGFPSGTNFEYYVYFKDESGEVLEWRETEYVRVL